VTARMWHNVHSEALIPSLIVSEHVPPILEYKCKGHGRVKYMGNKSFNFHVKYPVCVGKYLLQRRAVVQGGARLGSVADRSERRGESGWG
jgi:hypothetical protein